MAGTILCRDLLDGDGDSIVGVERVPIRIKYVLGTARTWQEEGIATKAGQGVAIALICCQADSVAMRWSCRTIAEPIR